jgi:hypothetical protein
LAFFFVPPYVTTTGDSDKQLEPHPHFFPRPIISANDCNGIPLDLLLFPGGKWALFGPSKENGSVGSTTVTPRIHLEALAERWMLLVFTSI